MTSKKKHLVPAELFEEEPGDEREQVVLGRVDLVALELDILGSGGLRAPWRPPGPR